MELSVEQMEIIYRAGGNNSDVRKIEAGEVVMDWDMAAAGLLPLELLPLDDVLEIRRMVNQR